MSLYSLGVVTVHAYRVYTADWTTAGTVVTGAFVEAEEQLEDQLRRRLPSEERIEPMRIYPDGRVYPKAYPITACASMVIDGRSLVGATPDATPFIGVFEQLDVPLATVTYTGGFTDRNGAAPLPITLEYALYDLARALAQDAPAVPVGATAASVGDVSVTFAKPTSGALDALVPGLTSRIGMYRNRWA